MSYPIHTNFNRHFMTERDKEKAQQLHVLFMGLAMQIGKLVPEGLEQTNALTRLEETMFWSNAGISRN
jgi:hypothetical protein